MPIADEVGVRLSMRVKTDSAVARVVSQVIGLVSMTRNISISPLIPDERRPNVRAGPEHLNLATKRFHSRPRGNDAFESGL